MGKFQVTLPIDVDGVTHLAGSVIELDEDVALEYRHALIALPQTGEEK